VVAFPFGGGPTIFQMFAGRTRQCYFTKSELDLDLAMEEAGHYGSFGSARLFGIRMILCS